MGRSSSHFLPSVLMPFSSISFLSSFNYSFTTKQEILHLLGQVGHVGLLLYHPDGLYGLDDSLRRAVDHDPAVLPHLEIGMGLPRYHIDHVTLPPDEPRNFGRGDPDKLSRWNL